jgi:4-carboxymuconolactone decarboxylase
MTDRLPLPETLTPPQQTAVDAITNGPRGALLGPFVPLLRSPELMTRLQKVGEFLRYQSAVPDHLRELAILIVARHWDQHYEWGHHVPLARAAGLDEAVIVAIAARGDVCGPADVQATWQLVHDIIEHRGASAETYCSALHELGDVTLIEVVGITGYYTTLAMTMNVAHTPVPDDYERIP